MVSQVVAAEYVVRFLSETDGYERGAQAVNRANQQVNRSEQQLTQQRQRREQQEQRQEQQRRRAQRQQVSGIGRNVLTRLPGGAAGLGLAGAAGFGVAGLGAAGVATAGVGAAAIGIAALGTAAVQAAIELGSIQGIQLADEFELLKQETRLLLAEWGTALIPIIRPVVQGLTNFVATLRRLNILGEEEFATGGRADVGLTRDDRGRIGFEGRRSGVGARGGDGEPFRISISGVVAQALEGIGRLLLEDALAYGELIRDSALALGNLALDGIRALGDFARQGVAVLGSFAIEGVRALAQLLPDIGNAASNAADAIGDRILRNLQDVIDLRGGSVTGPLAQALGFQRGGIVPATPGGILGRIGEGGQSEAIAPISDLVTIIRRALGVGSAGGSDIGVVDQFRAALANANEQVSLESRLDAADARMAQSTAGAAGTTTVNTGLTATYLTRSEYDALTDEQKAGRFFGIKRAAPAGG